MAFCGSCTSWLPFDQFSFARGKPIYKCKACRAARERDRRRTDPEHLRALDQRRYQRTGSRHSPARYQRNRAEWDARTVAWINANRERRREISRESRKRRRLADPERARRQDQRNTTARHARKANADVRSVTDRDLRRLLDRQHGRCFHCDGPDAVTIDHLIPLSRNGRHAIGNLVWACKSCNSAKGPRLLVEYRHGRSRRRIAV